MKIVALTEDTIVDFTGFIEEDMAENIGRVFYDGIAVKDGDTPVAGMIWTLINTMSDTGRTSRIVWLKTEDEETFDMLFNRYREIISGIDISKSEIYLPAKTGRFEKQALKNIGFKVSLTEGDIISARLSEIAEIGFVKKLAAAPNIMSLRNATQRGFGNAIRRMTNDGHFGVHEDIAYLPRLFFENDVSCYSEEDGVINGLFLCHKTPSGMLEVVLMSAIGADYVKILPKMIAFACKSAMEMYDPDTKVIINRHNVASLALGEKLFPREMGIPMYVGVRDESF